jgi:hypothetical protein
MHLLHISPRILQTLRSNGTLPYSRIGNKIYYKRSDIQRILQDNYIMYKFGVMGTISKELILNKTHYGTDIYSHILRLYYPDEIVMHIAGRDCGTSRNPFNDGKNTLHIFIEKTDPTNVLSAEFAKHTDSETAIAAGDAFSFAELHYKQSGEELLQTINKELHLRIGEESNFYANTGKPPVCSQITKSPCSPFIPLFSFFKAPISNTKPHKAVSLLLIYNTIKGDFYKDRTEKLRAISDVAQARKFKIIAHFQELLRAATIRRYSDIRACCA